ncbi:PIG-L family deacetylase [candidate division KSB1 bacterium]|nr:PIG-L family deacetylase [candidate division KSB1 bacterium]
MNILAIGAHPDDIEYGCGGALIHHARQGENIFLYIASEGEYGKNAKNRRNEQYEAAKILRAKQVFWGGFTDTEVPCNRKHISILENILSKTRADYVFVHHVEDTHQDHRNLSHCALTAARYIPNFLFYEGPTTQNFNPNVFVDIEDVLDDKMKLLESHQSQVNKTNINSLTIMKMAYSNVNFRGIQGRVKFAEAFLPQRLILK